MLLSLRICLRLDDIIDGTNRVTHAGGSTRHRLEWEWFYNVSMDCVQIYNRLPQDQRQEILTLRSATDDGDSSVDSIRLKSYSTMIRSVEQLCIQHLVNCIARWKERIGELHQDDAIGSMCMSRSTHALCIPKLGSSFILIQDSHQTSASTWRCSSPSGTLGGRQVQASNYQRSLNLQSQATLR